MHIVTVNDFVLDKNEIKWTLNGIKFNVKYMFDIDKRFIDTFKLIPLIQTCCIAASYKKKVKIVSNIPIRKETLDFINEYMNLQHQNNMYRMTKYPIDYPLKLELEFPINNGIEPQKHIANNKCVMAAWSGGKDSYLTIKLLEECGYNVVTGTTAWNNLMFNTGQNVFLNKHPEIKKNIVAKISLGSKMRIIISNVLQEQKINIRKELFSTQMNNDPFMLYHAWYMLLQNINNVIYAQHYNIRHVFSGDEADINHSTKELDINYIMYSNLGQCYDVKKIINKYFRSIYGKSTTQTHSILYPIYGPLEIKILIERYNTNMFSSCYTMTGKTGVCSKCAKCFMSLITLKSLGYDPGIVGIDIKKMIKNYKSQPEKIMDSIMSISDEYKYWFIKRCINDPDIGVTLKHLLKETPDDISFNPLVPLKEKYKTIPKFIRSKVTKIYDEFIR